VGVSAEAGRAILIVEDDADQRSLLGDLLKDDGFTVIEAANGQLAFDYLLNHREVPCLILLDLNMPVMSGEKFIEVTQNYLRFAQVPIAIVSVERLSRVHGCNVVGSFTKPFDVDQLLALVSTFARPADAHRRAQSS
jgi:DNA-binding response OmpR family regulator